MSALPASAAGTGSISGTVTAAAGGAPLAGICVGAYVRGADATLVTSIATAADGTYTLSGIPVGNVDVLFSGVNDCPGGAVPTNVVNQWYNNQLTEDTAASVAVADSVTTAGVNASMVAGGTITGKVTARVGGAPLNHICVSAFVPGVDEILAASISTLADGTYTMTGVPAGGVNVEFYSSGFCPDGVASNYVVQWYNNQPTSGTAASLNVAAGSTSSNINAALDASGSFSGKVTAAVGGAPLSGICVAAYLPYAAGVPPTLISSTSTAADGTYRLDGAPVGTIDVKFYSTGFCPGGTASNFAMQWYNNELLQLSADTINITAGGVTPNINAALVAGGTISGHVTAAVGGANLSGICVAVFSTGDEPVVVASIGTSSDGTYVLDGIPAGTVEVRFNSQGFCAGGNLQQFATQWYNNQPDFAHGQGVTVTDGVTTPGIDAVMQPPIATHFSITVNGSATSASIAHGATATLAEIGLPATYGPVVFSAPGQPDLCTITFPGTPTSCTTSTLPVGHYTPITAHFADADGAFTSSDSTNTVGLTVTAIPSSFSIKVNGGASASISHGATSTLSETGISGSATGSVVFGSPGHANLCTITLPATSCTTSTALPVGGYTPISAVFNDTDGSFSGSTSTNTVALTVAPVATSFTIAANGGSAASILQGGMASLSVTGLPVSATGSVVFSTAAQSNLCTVTLPATTCDTSAALPVGVYSPISALFTDTDGGFAGATSTNTVSVTVAPNPTSFTIKLNTPKVTGVSTLSIEHGVKVTLSEVGLPAAATGTVVFKSASNATLCTITLPATSCTTSAALKAGTYSLTAIYTPGSASYTGSTSVNHVSLKVMTTPGSPGNVRAGKLSAKKVVVTWTAPTNNGGSAITGYLVTFGGKAIWVPASARRATFAGLGGGHYHFRVRAINKVGTSSWSGRSNQVNL